MQRLLFFFLTTVSFFCFAVMFSYCQNVKKNGYGLVEDFDRFYDRFHSDTVFQKSRIKFPLKGQIVDETGVHLWSKKNWVVMRVKIQDVDTSLFKVESIKHEIVFIEKFWIEDSGFFSEYRFELIKNKWFLVYAFESNL